MAMGQEKKSHLTEDDKAVSKHVNYELIRTTF